MVLSSVSHSGDQTRITNVESYWNTKVQAPCIRISYEMKSVDDSGRISFPHRELHCSAQAYSDFIARKLSDPSKETQELAGKIHSAVLGRSKFIDTYTSPSASQVQANLDSSDDEDELDQVSLASAMTDESASSSDSSPKSKDNKQQ